MTWQVEWAYDTLSNQKSCNFLARIDSVNVSLLDKSHPFCQGEAGQLILSAPLTSAKIELTAGRASMFKILGSYEPFPSSVHEGLRSDGGPFALDVPLVCVSIVYVKGNDTGQMYIKGLIIAPRAGQAEVFERCEYFCTYDEWKTKLLLSMYV